MAIKRPDIYEHNNDVRAIADTNFIRGGARVVNTLNELYALYANKDQLKEFVTKVYITSLDKFYLLIDMEAHDGSSFEASAWKELVNDDALNGVPTTLIETTWQNLVGLRNTA